MRDAGIMDGDLLAVQKASEAKNGQIVVARLGDDVTVKRLRRTRHGVELLPENPDFEPIVVPPDSDDFALEGIAVGLIRNTMLDVAMAAIALPRHAHDGHRGAPPPRKAATPPSASSWSSCPTSARPSPPTCAASASSTRASWPSATPSQLYQALCRATGQRQDPCVLDTFMAATDFMRGAPARPWWAYTAERKQRFGVV